MPNPLCRELSDKVTFLYRIVDGDANHSYGIQVAKLADLPPASSPASGKSSKAWSQATRRMWLSFGPRQAGEPSKAELGLEGIDPDARSLREAHDMLYRLKYLLNKPGE